jgi:hypothetical protein
MANSLFHKESPEEKPANRKSSIDLIEKEIGHLKKGRSVRHGSKVSGSPPWLIVIALCGLAWLYLMDPFYHAWYKGEAIRAYLYLHTYGAGPEVGSLVSSQILSQGEITLLNQRSGSFRDYYKSPDAAARKSDAIVAYMNEVNLLHEGKYQPLDPVGRMRCLLFVRTGLILPREWAFLDPNVSG